MRADNACTDTAWIIEAGIKWAVSYLLSHTH